MYVRVGLQYFAWPILLALAIAPVQHWLNGASTSCLKLFLKPETLKLPISAVGGPEVMKSLMKLWMILKFSVCLVKR